MGKKYTGHCACGQVTYGFDTEPTSIGNCHCTDCKRASGAEMTTWVVVPETDFTVLSGSTKSFSYGPNTETCAGLSARFHNAGQVCLAAKRFILVGKIADEFERSFVEAAKSLRVGDPFNSATNLGPMARADLRDSLHKQVEGSIAKGASLLCGGKPVEGKGAFYPPTVLSGVTEGMPAFDEETFGPVAALTRVPDVDSAVRAANASQFGLSSNLWTRDVELACKVARDLYTGGVFINGFTATDPRVPVGGVKNSGYGRELSHFGAHAFVNAQTVWIEAA